MANTSVCPANMGFVKEPPSWKCKMMMMIQMQDLLTIWAASKTKTRIWSSFVAFFTSSLLILPFQVKCTYVLLSSIRVNTFHFHVACNHCSLPWSHLRYNFKILPEHQLQNLEQTLKPYPQSPNKNLTLWPKLIFQICTKLLSTCFPSSTSTTVTTSTSFELLSSHARVTLIKFTKQEWVSESVS